MHAILVSMGTDGDVFPFIGLGIRLHARGHRVTLVANESYRSLASRHDLGFRSLVSESDTKALLGNPDVWHPRRSAVVGARWMGRVIEGQYALLSDMVGDGDAVLLAYTPIFAARLVAEKLSTPLASIATMPWMVPSVSEPPTLTGVVNLPRWAPRLVVRVYWRLLEALADLLVGRHVNRVRRSIGLKPIGRVARWSFSPQLVVGMFPPWFAAPQSDWPPRMRLAGFPMFDGCIDEGLPEEVEGFCRAGQPPVAVTFGTGMMHGERMFHATLQACEAIGARAILLTKFGQQLPTPLPPTALHCRYAPFQQLLPRCAAVVHHGGFGTTAHALAAATPQLILPMAWDQQDNAARVKRLGVGQWLRPHSRSSRIADALRDVMAPQTQARCRELAAEFSADDSFDIAARWIEELADEALPRTP